MVCTGFHVRRTFLPKNSMCGAQLCSHSSCPHSIALPPHPTPPHPTPDLEPLSSSRSSCFHPHCTSSTCSRLHTRIEEHCSWSPTTIPLVNLFNSSTRASFFVHMITSVYASSVLRPLRAILDKTRSEVGPTGQANAST